MQKVSAFFAACGDFLCPRYFVTTIAIMLLGVLAGRFVPLRAKPYNEKFQLCATLLLIFSMGISLGARESFFAELARIGRESLLFCLLPTAGSIACVHPLSRRFMDGGAKAGNGTKQTLKTSDPMVFLAVGALLSGIACGAHPAAAAWLAFLPDHSEALLDLLMVSVGLSVGMRRGLLAIIRHYHVKILVIPAGIIAGSLAGGLVCALLLDYPAAQALSIAGGLGWYSLAGVAIGNLAGPELGSIAFLASLMREIFSFFLIPYVARFAGPWTAIAPAAATSEDTTLPMLIRYTNEETVVFAVVNGILCSAAVPFLIAFCY